MTDKAILFTKPDTAELVDVPVEEPKRGEVLVRLLYNERDLAFPIADCGTPYFYRWEDLRAFALNRIDVARSILASTQAPPRVKNY